MTTLDVCELTKATPEDIHRALVEINEESAAVLGEPKEHVEAYLVSLLPSVFSIYAGEDFVGVLGIRPVSGDGVYWHGIGTHATKRHGRALVERFRSLVLQTMQAGYTVRFSVSIQSAQHLKFARAIGLVPTHVLLSSVKS